MRNRYLNQITVFVTKCTYTCLCNVVYIFIRFDPSGIKL